MKRISDNQLCALAALTRQDKIRFIRLIADAAVEDWRDRRICLPSVTIAIAIEGTDWGREPVYREQNCLFPRRHDGIFSFATTGAAVRSHSNYLATWYGEGQQEPNWNDLGKEHYILAVQCLQDAKYPYSSHKDYEAVLVELIERYGLTVYDAG